MLRIRNMWLAFAIVDIAFCAWSNIIFTLVCHNYFYYALIAIGYISNYERKKSEKCRSYWNYKWYKFLFFSFFEEKKFVKNITCYQQATTLVPIRNLNRQTVQIDEYMPSNFLDSRHRFSLTFPHLCYGKVD